MSTQPPPGSWTVACSQCGTHIDASGLSRPKGIPPPMRAPRAGVMRSALVGGWQEVLAASQRAFSEGSENARSKPSRPDVLAGRKRSSSSSESSTGIGISAKKGPHVTVATGAWGKAATGTKPQIRLPPAAPSSGTSNLFRETEVGLALKLTKVERGFRRSPASSTGGPPSIGEPIGRPPSSGLSSSTRGIGRVPPAIGTAGTRKRSGWRGGWKRPSRDDSMLSSSSPHSELDAASFSRSLQAQAAAMRAALWSSTSHSQSQSQSQSESESHHRQRSGNGSTKISNFTRKAAAVQPINAPKASPGSMRAALDAGRVAASAIGIDPMAVSTPTAIVPMGEGVDRTANPMLIAPAGMSSASVFSGSSRGGPIAAGRPPAHRVPPLRLDSPGLGEVDGQMMAVNPFRTPPAGGGLLQPWVGGARRPTRRAVVRGTWGHQQQQQMQQYQRSAQNDSIATTSQVSRTSQTSIGMSSAASYSPDAGAGILAGGQCALGTPVSSPSAASETSRTEVLGPRWSDSTFDLKGEHNLCDNVEEILNDAEDDDGEEAGAAKTRKLIGTPAGGGTFRRTVPLLWGASTYGTDDGGCESPVSGAGAAKTRKLIHTPSNVHRYRRTEHQQTAVDECFAVGVPVEVISVGGAVVAGPEGEEAPPTDTLDETPVVKAQWVQQSPGHLV